MLATQVARTDWIWIEGNHDPHPPAWLGGTVTASSRLAVSCFAMSPPCLGNPARSRVTCIPAPPSRVTAAAFAAAVSPPIRLAW